MEAQMEVSCRSNERLGAGIEQVGFVDIVRALVGCLPTKSGAAVVRAKVSTGAELCTWLHTRGRART